MWSLITFFSLASAVFAAPTGSRTTAPSGCLVVSKNASSGQYKTVQAAVDKLSTSSSSAQCIFIDQGTYNEQVYIKALAGPLTLYGYTSDVSGYAGNKVTITQKLSQDDVANNDLTATLRAWTSNLKVYNINLANTRGKGSQALAVSASADKQGYYGVKFTGFQDTILAQTGAQVYAKCYIEGATDFIFGQRAAAWFDGSDIRVVANSIGYITASGRDSSSNPNYYVINKSNVAAASGNSVAAGAFYLGRPWRNYARVVFQNTALSNVINAAGWRSWNTDDPRTDKVEFGEYGNTGDGSKGTRASFSKKLSAAVKIETVLGSSYKDWVDTAYLS